MIFLDDQRMWCSVAEAARSARVPERTLRRAISDGKVRAVRESKRRTIVHLSDVAAWLLVKQRDGR